MSIPTAAMLITAAARVCSVKALVTRFCHEVINRKTVCISFALHAFSIHGS
jgi:predicted MFS family arabinose efflux permease